VPVVGVGTVMVMMVVRTSCGMVRCFVGSLVCLKTSECRSVLLNFVELA
jgi:hypothetical protein